MLVTGHLAMITAGLVGCRMSLSPIKNRIGIGVESYVVFDADGEGGQGDLYAGSAGGGSAYRITFSRAHESSPALSPDGSMLAFVRGGTREDSTSHRVWIMNLLNGAERELPSMGPSAHPRRIAWSPDGHTVYVRTSTGDFLTPAPPLTADFRPVVAGTAEAADSALGVMLGEPRRARVITCPDGRGFCVSDDSGVSQMLTSDGRDPFRWGSDSVGFWLGDEVEVRPLRGGTTRQLRWAGTPSNPHETTQFPGGAPKRSIKQIQY